MQESRDRTIIGNIESRTRQNRAESSGIGPYGSRSRDRARRVSIYSNLGQNNHRTSPEGMEHDSIPPFSDEPSRSVRSKFRGWKSQKRLKSTKWNGNGPEYSNWTRQDKNIPPKGRTRVRSRTESNWDGEPRRPVRNGADRACTKEIEGAKCRSVRKMHRNPLKHLDDVRWGRNAVS